MATSYEQTQKVHDLLTENLNKEKARLDQLREYEADVARQIEDSNRVVLSVERAIAMLRHGIPDTAPPMVTEQPVPTSLREAIKNVSLQENRENYHFTDEDIENRYNESIGKQQEE
jgi:hypothetical protein